MEGLRKNEAQLEKLCERLGKGVWWGERRLRRNIKMLSGHIRKEVLEHLCSTSEEFRMLAEINCALINNSEITWSIQWGQRGVFGQVNLSMIGEIHDNGYIYLDSEQEPLYFRLFFGVKSKFYGHVNALGMMSLQALDGNSWSTCPSYFYGGINSDGKVRIEAKEARGLISKNEWIEGFIADPFSGDEVKRRTFLKNKALMEKAILAFRNDLVSSQDK